jgi:leader peptidase (prepilin peptidase)/N-methyltransferase
VTLVAIVPATITAVITGLVVNPILHRLPEPARSDGPPSAGPRSTGAKYEDSGHVDKIPYAQLADRRVAGGCALISLALGFMSWTLLPPLTQAPWTVLATLGVVLAIIDLRTTWLPKRLTHLGWLLMAAAVALTAILTGDQWVGVRGLLGALAAGAVYGLVWAVSRGGFGFGDVRYAPLIGAAAGTESWAVWGWALLLGTLVGGVVGIVRLIRGRQGSFPYAPAILLGCYLALAVSAVT